MHLTELCSPAVVVVVAAVAAAAVRSSVAAGAAIARQIGSSSLLYAVRTAYAHGLDEMLWVCCGIAIGAALLALVCFAAKRGRA